jgi:hypothetical protein
MRRLSAATAALAMVAVLSGRANATGPIVCFSNLCLADAPDGGIGVFSISGRYLGNLIWTAPEPTATPTQKVTPTSTPSPNRKANSIHTQHTPPDAHVCDSNNPILVTKDKGKTWVPCNAPITSTASLKGREDATTERMRQLAAGAVWETCSGNGDVECSMDGKTWYPAVIVNGVRKCKPPPAAEHREIQPLPHARVSPSRADLQRRSHHLENGHWVSNL